MYDTDQINYTSLIKECSNNEYEAKKAARIQRYEVRATKARTEADRLFGQARQAVAGIEPGQPILIGHHSEKKHRRALARHDRRMEAAFEAQDRAAYWEQRAAAAENNQAISADDPDALDKLRFRLEKLSAAQEAMKTINRAFKAKRLGELGYRPEQIAALQARMEEAFPWERRPYPGYVLKNNNANMRRIKQRIADLVRQEGLEEVRETVNGMEIVQDVEAKRTRLYFPQRPSAELRAMLKQRGFRWAPSEGCWQRRLSGLAWEEARRVAEQYGQRAA